MSFQLRASVAGERRPLVDKLAELFNDFSQIHDVFLDDALSRGIVCSGHAFCRLVRERPCVLARGIKLPNVAAVQRSHDTDARHHGRPIEFDNQEQGFDCGLPRVEIPLSLGKLLDIVRGVLEGDELAAVGNPLVAELPQPAARRTVKRPRSRGVIG